MNKKALSLMLVTFFSICIIFTVINRNIVEENDKNEMSGLEVYDDVSKENNQIDNESTYHSAFNESTNQTVEGGGWGTTLPYYEESNFAIMPLK